MISKKLLRAVADFRFANSAVAAFFFATLTLTSVPATAADAPLPQPHPYVSDAASSTAPASKKAKAVKKTHHKKVVTRTAAASKTQPAKTATVSKPRKVSHHKGSKSTVASADVGTRHHHRRPSAGYTAAARHHGSGYTAEAHRSPPINPNADLNPNPSDPINVAKPLNDAEAAAVLRRHEPIQVQSTLSLPLDIESRAALVTNAQTGAILYGKNATQTMPIASITKLMTAMVVLDAGLSLNDLVTVSDTDVDHLRHTTSRLSVGTTLPRGEMMLIALMASENRAASALANTYPGGTAAAVNAMNRKAQALGMTHTIFHDPTGLNGGNMSTPADLVKMVQAAERYPDIRRSTTTAEHQITSRGRPVLYKNTNALVKKPEWNIEVSKTGFINEAGRCLVMMAHVSGTPVVIVLMDSVGKYTRIGDAQRVKRWLEVALRSS